MSGLAEYHALIEGKRNAFQARGLQRVPELSSAMYDHQRHSTEFALRAGCAALFLDTGLGKSLCALEWGRVIVGETNKPVLMLAPLAVAQQHVREAERFGIDAQVVRSEDEIGAKRIYVTNYDRLEKFDPSRFGGVVLDESSILKSFTGKTTRKLIEAFARTPFRLACTATPAPNDHTELGTHAEFLGVMRREEMLPIWFINDTMDTGTWRIKGHAREDFWSWVASWARCIGTPSDIGFDDAGFALPALEVHHHEVAADRSIDTGEEKNKQARLFRIPDTSATSIHKEKRLTIEMRAKLAAEIVFGDSGCPGSQNTPKGAAPSISPTLQSGSAENNKAEIQQRTRNTCENITKSGLRNSSEAQRSKPSTMSGGASDMALMSNIENEQEHYPDKEILPKKETCGSNQHSALVPPTMTPLPNGKVVDAPFATLPLRTEEAIASLSTTAMGREQSEVCFASTATRASESSKTIQTGSGEPQNISNERDWWVVWCDTDYEQDALEGLFGDRAISIRGSMPNEKKEYLHEAWLRGDRRILICKPTMFGYGLNWQHCCKMLFVGISFSYEQFYQAVRRCWRFGQRRPVHVHVVCADTERAIWTVVERKAGDHEVMKREMVAAMRRSMNAQQSRKLYSPSKEAKLPAWIGA